MSLSALKQWCTEARPLLGEPGRVFNEKWDGPGNLRSQEGAVVGTIMTRPTWDKAVNSLGTTTDPGAKDKIVNDLGKSLAQRKLLFGNTAFTAQGLELFEPVADKYGEVGATYPKAIASSVTEEGKLGGLTEIEALGNDKVEQIKAETKRLDKRLKDAIRTAKSPADANTALEELERWLEGLAALNGDFGKIRAKFSSVETWGKVEATDLVQLARIEKRVGAAQSEYKEALKDVYENRDREGRGYFIAKVEKLEKQYEDWEAGWKKLTNIYTRMESTSAEGLAGIETILADAWDLASSDEYLVTDEGLKALKADCDNGWQAFAAANAAARPGLRGVTASEKVRDLNSGRSWKRSYRIGDGVYKLSVSRSAGGRSSATSRPTC